MKTLSFLRRFATLATSLCLVSLPVAVADAQNAGNADVNATASTPAVVQPQLPYGVADVLKMSRAQISDDLIVNFIRNSGTVYSLTPDDIVYLRKEGVSDAVIDAMLDQHKKALELSQVQAPITHAPVTVAPEAPQDSPAAAPSQPAPVYVQPSTSAPSTVYVVPYPATPYYAPYYGYGPYYGPTISLGFGFGGYYGGHYHGHGYWHGHGYHHH